MSFFGRIRKRICDLRSFGSCRIKGTDESLSRVDSSAPLMRHELNDVRLLIRFRILPKKCTPGLSQRPFSWSAVSPLNSIARCSLSGAICTVYNVLHGWSRAQKNEQQNIAPSSTKQFNFRQRSSANRALKWSRSTGSFIAI